MIGILCAEEEKMVVREFFELFKTPWEFVNEAMAYDVVISTKNEMPKIDASLVIIFSSNFVQFDSDEGITLNLLTQKRVVYKEKKIPIYGNLLSFQDSKKPLIHSEATLAVIAFEMLKPQGKFIRVGFDIFSEISFLLSKGQPLENALIPTLEIYISIIRDWIISAELPLIEIPPIPFGYSFLVCLTHDIDFVSIRQHKFDKTMWGFIYRGTIGSFFSFLKGKININSMIKNWLAVLKLPFIFAGFAEDFWGRFDKYAEIDGNFGSSSTFFIIPHKNNPGIKAISEDHYGRASAYDIQDIKDQANYLANSGFEIALHGLDAWHNVELGLKEINEIANLIKESQIGIRMHWLYYDSKTPNILEDIGFDYDATLGYNETVGFRNGTTQAFVPLGIDKLLEIPLNVQDTALFYPRRLSLRYDDARKLCQKILDSVSYYGGLVTLSWHDRSLESERLWGDFYIELLKDIQAQGAWFGSARQVASWFRYRRSIKFVESTVTENFFRLKLDFDQPIIQPQAFLRIYIPSKFTGVISEDLYQKTDMPLNGQKLVELFY